MLGGSELKKKEGMGVSRRGQGRRNILLNKKHHQRTQLICNSNYANKNLTQATEVTKCALNDFDSWYTSSNLLQAPFFKIKMENGVIIRLTSRTL